MAGCVNTGQALTRGLKAYRPRNTYALPFLYQTPTLRRYYSELQNLAKEHQAKTVTKDRAKTAVVPKQPRKDITKTSPKRPYRAAPADEEFVPFETSEEIEIEPNLASDVLEGASITDAERRVFEQLETLASSKSRPSSKEPKADVFMSLDDVLNEAISKIEQHALAQRKRQSFTTRAEGAQGLQEATALPAATGTADLSERVFQELIAARTDVELWRKLEDHLFTPIAALNLDSNTYSALAPSFSNPQGRRGLMAMFPRRLVTAASILRSDFSTSNLILSLLPRLRSLGPSAYALGATPKLYNQIMAFQFERYTDLDGMSELLREMEKEFIEPNTVTLQLLDYVMAFGKGVQMGRYGMALKTVWATEKFRRSFETLGRWKVRVEAKVREQEIKMQQQARLAEEKEAEAAAEARADAEAADAETEMEEAK